jgi:uncharacterized protein (UPF0276 family)
VGLRFAHHRAVLERRPAMAWFEVHAENYAHGGLPLQQLERIRADHPVALHAVGLSLGGTDPLDRDHLARLKALADRIEPGLVSDHLSWSTADGEYLADLLPLPYTEEALAVVAAKVDRVQDALGRRLLVENPSACLAFTHSTLGEAEFLAALVARTGCALLCDVNNLCVSRHNVGLDALGWLAAVPAAAVLEIHLAGHAVRPLPDGGTLRIDDHGSAVPDQVWALYAQALQRFGAVPTLVEWDTAIPDFAVLAAEAAKAQRLLDHAGGGVDAAA